MYSIYKKRGFVAIQFHWIFVLVAGAFILLLFSIFISSGIDGHEKKTAAKLINNFDTLFKAFSSETGDVNKAFDSKDGIVIQSVCANIDVGNMKGYDSYFQLKGEEGRRPVDNLLLFSLDEIRGKELYTKSHSFEVPFPLGSFLYITDPNVHYIFFGTDADTQDLRKIRNLLPTGASSEITTDLLTVDLGGYEDVVIVTLNGMPPWNDDIEDHYYKYPVYFVRLFPSGEDLFQGKVSFVKKDAKKTIEHTSNTNSQQLVGYYKEGMLLGAIMGGSYDRYICNVKKINEKMEFIVHVLEERSLQLADSALYRGGSACATQAGTSASILSAFAYSDKANIDVAMYRDFEEKVKKQNEALILASCPLLY